MKEKFLNALKDKDFSELFKKGGISFLMRIGGQILGFVITFIIANYFGAKGLGDYVLSIIVLRLFTLISKLGIDTASIRFIASYTAKKQWSLLKSYRIKVVRVLLVSSIFFSFIMYFYATPIASLVGAKEIYIRLNSFFVFPMALFMLNYQSLRGLKNITAYSFFYWMGRLVFSVIIMLIAVQFSRDKYIPIFAFLFGLLLVALLSHIVFKKNINKHQIPNFNQHIDVVKLKNILAVSLPLMLAQSGQFVMAWTDKLMLGGMSSVQDVGIYDVAFKLSMIVSVALTSITSITAPKFAELFALKDYKRLEKVVNQSTKLIFWSSIPILIGLFLSSFFILGYFGDEFEQGKMAFYLLSSATMISAFSGPAGNLLQMTGRQITFMNVLFVGAVINIALNYYLIPIYGIEGAALASMGSIIFWNLTMVYYVKKEFGFLTIFNPFKKR